jgi:hypothetical protein
VGDGPTTSNTWMPNTLGAVGFQEVDLGTITVPAATVGSQRWVGQVEAYSPGGTGPGVHLDYLVLIPVSDGYGKARAVYSFSAGVVVGIDQFTSTTAGNALDTRSAPSGGTWATSGDATDFAFADDLSGEQVKRATTATETNGRFAILGSTSYTDIQVDAAISLFGAAGFGAFYGVGVIARWVDSSNYVRAYLGTSGFVALTLQQVVAGVSTTFGTSSPLPFNPTGGAGSFYTVRLIAFASGRVIAVATHTNSGTTQSLDVASSALATGGALATGKPGFWDRNFSGSGHTRYVDDFTISTPAAEPIAIYSGRNMQIRYDDTLPPTAAAPLRAPAVLSRIAVPAADRHEPRAREGAPQRHRSRGR